jgi:hypothetical protein
MLKLFLTLVRMAINRTKNITRRCWSMPEILAIWEADSGRIIVQGLSEEIDQETPSPK